MNRRRFLGAAAGAALAPAAAAIGQAPQDSTPGPADPLPWPGVAGAARAEVEPMDNDATVKAIEQRLRCNCGCGLNIFTCRTTDFTCSVSPALHREVVALLGDGRTPRQVEDDFVAKYGESILMAPRPRGLGMLGYVLPGAAVLVAGGLLAAVLVRRGRLAAAGTGATSGPSPAPRAAAVASPAELARLEQSLRDLD
jgi:cytochrome c-type biogenesis protein CcmH